MSFLRPRTLQSRLIASHTAVILVALALFFAFGSIAINRYERRTQVDRVLDLAVPLTLEANSLYRRETPFSNAARQVVEQALTYASDEMDIRLFLLDDNATVIYDSDPGQGLINLAITPYQQTVSNLMSDTGSTPAGGVNRVVAPEADALTSPMLDGQTVVLGAVGNTKPNVVLGVAASPEPEPLLRRLVLSLLLAAGGSLTLAVVVAVLVSRRIAAPVSGLTSATEEMSRGKLAQAVPGEGDDEIGRLVRGFNAMSRQVAEVDASQREFLANAAHDLRTPLTTITGYIQAMRDGLITEPDARDRTLATIAAESDRMSRLIRDLLDLARLQSGQLALYRQPTGTQQLISSAVERFAMQATEKQITIQQEGDDISISIDRDRFARVLDNLLANAIRHTPVNGIIRIRAHSRNDRIEVSVEDSGPGISPALLPKLFDRYTRGSDTADRNGLGLAVAREIVAAHGGAITAENRPEGGARFLISLPLSA